MELQVSFEEVEKYLLKYFFSLRQYPDRYVPVVAEWCNKEALHLAYLCPLCLQNFLYYENETLHYSSSFSLDHFPPQNIEGKNEILVCKACNNKAGHDYENSFWEQVLLEAFSRNVPSITIKGKSEVDKVRGWVHTNVGISNDKSRTIQIPEKQGHRFPKLTEEEFNTNNFGKGFKMNIKFDQVNDRKAIKAIVKTAYLYCFEYWGYSFSFSFAGQMFRDVLSDKTTYPVTVPTKWIDSLLEINQSVKIPTGLVYLKKPKDMMAMFVNIPAEIKTAGYSCVIPLIIPSPDDENFQEMKRVQQMLDADQVQQIEMYNMPFELKMAVPDPYSRTWQELIKLRS
jgi:hypothetical protein